MRKLRSLRRLVVGDGVWLWSVRQKIDQNRYESCRLTLSLQREGTRARLAISFRPEGDRIISNTYFMSGMVTCTGDGPLLNLYEPGVVHRFLTAAAARGDLPTEIGTKEIDGWPLFDILTAPKADQPS